MSGVPVTLKSVVKLPADVPVKFLDKLTPTTPAVDPSSAIDKTSEESLRKSYS